MLSFTLSLCIGTFSIVDMFFNRIHVFQLYTGITPTEQSVEEGSSELVVDTKTAVLTPISQDDKLLL
jgi:hypothetical protein